MCKDKACGVWNSSTPKYEVLFVFYPFLRISLNVLVISFSVIQKITLKMKKLTNTNKLMHKTEQNGHQKLSNYVLGM